MPKPISRKELLRRLRLLGYVGPFPGGNYSGMRKGSHTVPIPNPHQGDIDWNLIKRILKQANISKKDWDALA